jgi:hypothetical protein
VATPGDSTTRTQLLGGIVLCALIAAGAGYWTMFEGGPIRPEETQRIRMTLREWELPRRAGTIVFRDEQGRSYRLAGDLNRFRLREWAATWKARGAEPYDFTLPRGSAGDPVDVYEVAQGDVRFVTLADINAFRAEERRYGYLLIALFLALSGLCVYAYRTEAARKKQPVPPGPAAVSEAGPGRSRRWPRLGQTASIRLAAAGCSLAGAAVGYVAMFVPWSEAVRGRNKVETSLVMIGICTVLIVAPLPYLVAPLRAVAKLGTTTHPTSLGRALAIAVACLGFVVHALFMAALRRMGYGG